MSQTLNIGDIIYWKDEKGEYVFVDLIVEQITNDGIYEVLDLLGNEGVYRVMWSADGTAEVL